MGSAVPIACPVRSAGSAHPAHKHPIVFVSSDRADRLDPESSKRRHMAGAPHRTVRAPFKAYGSSGCGSSRHHSRRERTFAMCFGSLSAAWLIPRTLPPFKVWNSRRRLKLCVAASIQGRRAYPLMSPPAQTEGARLLWFTTRLALGSMGITPLPRYYDEI